MNAQELKKILKLHKKWLNGDADGERADLQDADLSHAILCNADLRLAKLSYANLCKADLSRAKLSYADLRLANLRHANLHRDKDDCVALYPLRGENKSCRKEQTCL